MNENEVCVVQHAVGIPHFASLALSASASSPPVLYFFLPLSPQSISTHLYLLRRTSLNLVSFSSLYLCTFHMNHAAFRGGRDKRTAFPSK